MTAERGYVPFNTTAPVILALGHGTQVRLRGVGQVHDREARGYLPFDFIYEQRGRLSKRRIHKRLTRWVNNVLRETMVANPGRTQQRILERNARWNAKHVQFVV